MKKIVFLFVSLLIFLGFKNATDYRDTYTGTYTGERVLTSPLSVERLKYDTSSCTIIVSKNATDSIINIVTYDRTFTAKLKTSGLFYSNVSTVSLWGKFVSNKVQVYYNPSRAPIAYSYSGSK